MKPSEVLGKEAFGPQMFMEGGDYDLRLITDPAHVIDFLDLMPGKIGMTPITPPFVIRSHKEIQGIRLIAESHIYIKTVYDKGGFFLDIFSCKEFDIEKARLQGRWG
jgi:S-adenosylmethionine decarboxylase